MRFMVIIKADGRSEAGVAPTEAELSAMMDYNEELSRAGVMLAADGLLSSAHGVRVAFDGERRTVTDGPFTETKELIAGFWILQAASKEEAIEWVKRCPADQTEIEIRQVAEVEDFPEATPELREKEERLRAEAAKRASK